MRTSPGGFMEGTRLLASELNDLQDQIPYAIDGYEGGTYNISGMLNVESTGIISLTGSQTALYSSSGAIVVNSAADVNITGGDDVNIVATDDVTVQCNDFIFSITDLLTIGAGTSISIDSPSVTFSSTAGTCSIYFSPDNEIYLQAASTFSTYAGSTFNIAGDCNLNNGGNIDINNLSWIDVNSGGNIYVQSGGNIVVQSGGDIELSSGATLSGYTDGYLSFQPGAILNIDPGAVANIAGPSNFTGLLTMDVGSTPSLKSRMTLSGAGQIVNRSNQVGDDTVSLNPQEADHYWADNSTLSAGRQWQLLSNNIDAPAGSILYLATEETTHPISIHDPLVGTIITMKKATGFTSAITVIARSAGGSFIQWQIVGSYVEP